MTITPSLWYRIQHYLLRKFQHSSSTIHLRYVNFGGEICPDREQLKHFQYYPIEFRNLYGLSEMSCWASMFKIDFGSNSNNNDNKDIPIMGRSIIDTNVTLNQHNEIILESNIRKCLIFETNNGWEKNYSLLWSQRITNRIEANPIYSLNYNLVYVVDYSGSIHAFDLQSGRIVWQSKTDDQIKCSPIIFTGLIGELILCGSYDHHLYCWQQSNGHIHWKINVNESAIFSSPIVWYDQHCNDWFVAVCTLNGTIGCYHLIDGKQRWKRNHSNRPIFSTPKIIQDNLIIGMIDSRLISISLQNGDLIWELLLEKMPIFSSPCLVKQDDNDGDVRIIIGTNGCSIVCTKFNSKQPEWIFQTESNQSKRMEKFIY
ncbi:hypothetical protein BLA29_002911 [Euroglyphus maynei]|uniref:Pyrrolo-quinoline quinone repeat domain-containing protein n=1 Tax=Euroglyphus maynei TaxID=6958 RepID=A0A1Y3BNP5_EURMA|nr:hypothetical protein BLA29_002911 [Euroglyphus maynei]